MLYCEFDKEIRHNNIEKITQNTYGFYANLYSYI